ncbi:DUF411 domain-containing protein [Jiella endophytica]|uniref:DUF411 domain-containing protein n=1 Tax=Jiella endophytica TaxID=2558362 RepID=A0A4Y8R8U8_9HYPH|nr:DUF411 domain-containing protein [Jiella endophytica]TFF17655.1 DUF411 domain-containing protein [Jiella endophytica]
MKTVLASVLLAATTFGQPAPARADHDERHMTVVKSPTCGCCEAWVAIARKYGFEVETRDTDDLDTAKRLAGVPEPLRSCHTAEIGGYVVEGHVPMEAIEKLLSERPKIRGISVPGMPMGSPGMGDDPNARFDVHAFGTADGSQPVFYEAGR